MSSNKVYWKGLEELHETPSFVQNRDKEFAEELPMDEFLGNDKLDQTKTGRRDFLKFLGFSVTAAAVAACETPINKSLPYVIKPETITPGIPNYYTSTFFDDNDYANILVKTREGRPIFIEGKNPLTGSHSGISSRVIASVLGLYDSKRSKEPTKSGSAIDWDKADAEIIKSLGEIAASGKRTVILTSTIISPSTKKAVSEFAAKFGNIDHVTYDVISYHSMIKANAATFQKAVLPTYRFDEAMAVASFGADFLGTWLDSNTFASQFAAGRNPNKDMSRLFVFETNMSLTGANADYRTSVKHSEIAAGLVHLYNKLTGNKLPAANISFGDKIDACAAYLKKNAGKSLVVCGLNDTNAQVVTNEINQYLQNYGKTIDVNKPCFLKQGDDARVEQLVKELETGAVAGLILYNSNPVYTHPKGDKIKAAISKLKLSVSFADRADESGSACQYILPDHNYLESWNDFNPHAGHYSLSQPTIHPLFNTRQAQESFLVWSGLAMRGDKNNVNYREFMKEHWRSSMFPTQSKHMMFEDFWNYTVHDGIFMTGHTETAPAVDSKKKSVKENKKEEDIIIGSDVAPIPGMSAEPLLAPATASGSVNEAAAGIMSSYKSSGIEVVLYQKIGIGTGNQAANPWLQEMPDPVSKVTWDNYVTMSPQEMKEMGLNTIMGQEDPADLVKVTVNGVTIELPAVASPGQKKGTVGIALGYGRAFGKNGEVIGKNAYPLTGIMNGLFSYAAYGAKIEKSGTTYPIAATQTHHTMMGRDIVKETSHAQYKENPHSGNHKHTFHTNLKTLKGKEVHGGHLTADETDFWKKFDRPNHNWGLSIDLNSCNGCGACVIACHAENNVPVVGKDEIRRVREMHWMRIDRYYTSDTTKEMIESAKGLGDNLKTFAAAEIASENPQVVFQPVMCQHCSQAPCETVCPVLATTHSNEGLNQMTYNRCIGTRYCANNCPYKVRRFNWFKYHDNSKFDFYMNDDLGKMVLNPDVTVRSRGVMEKCSMCQQRIQYGKLEAKKERRRPVDGEIKTACMSACPTNAIIFGDYNDETSHVTALKKEARSYVLLEEVGTEPNVFYHVKVRNVDEKYHHEEVAHHEAEANGEHKADAHGKEAKGHDNHGGH